MSETQREQSPLQRWWWLIVILLLLLVFLCFWIGPGKLLFSPAPEAPKGQPTQEVTAPPPTDEPTETATEQPTEQATDQPTDTPTDKPTDTPTEQATEQPTEVVTQPAVTCSCQGTTQVCSDGGSTPNSLACPPVACQNPHCGDACSPTIPTCTDPGTLWFCNNGTWDKTNGKCEDTSRGCSKDPCAKNACNPKQCYQG